VSGRGDRVAVPATGTQWELRFSTKTAATNWPLACQQIPQAITDCFTACRDDPRQRTARHHPLRGDLATRVLQGRTMERWQHEITAGGRVWFLIDEEKHTIWIDEVHLGHPAKTGR